VSKEQNLAAQSIGGEIAVSHDYDRFDEVMAQGVLDHDRAEGQAPGVDGIKQYWRDLGEAFPDFELHVDALVADEEYVTVAYRLSGTQDGYFMGYPPTGKRFEVRSLQIGRFEDGLIVERWGSTDVLGILTQLGVERDAEPVVSS
jgi:predicted ester cyclase